MPANPDQRVRPLDREGFAADIGVMVEAAVEAGGRLGPQLLEDRDPLIGHGTPRIERGAVQRLEFLLQPAGADTQSEPAAGQDIERGRHFRCQHRIAIGQYQHRGNEPQPLRCTRHNAEDRERFQGIAHARVLTIQRVGVGGLAFDREDDVVGDHRRIQSQLLAFPCQGENTLARRSRSAGGEIKAITHSDGSLSNRCRNSPISAAPSIRRRECARSREGARPTYQSPSMTSNGWVTSLSLSGTGSRTILQSGKISGRVNARTDLRRRGDRRLDRLFPSRRGVETIVIERTGLACAASGKSGGFLAFDWCDGTRLASLARRSFALHARLAHEIGSESNYGPLTTYAGFMGRRERANSYARNWLSADVSVSQHLGSAQT